MDSAVQGHTWTQRARTHRKTHICVPLCVKAAAAAAASPLACHVPVAHARRHVAALLWRCGQPRWPTAGAVLVWRLFRLCEWCNRSRSRSIVSSSNMIHGYEREGEQLIAAASCSIGMHHAAWRMSNSTAEVCCGAFWVAGERSSVQVPLPVTAVQTNAVAVLLLQLLLPRPTHRPGGPWHAAARAPCASYTAHP